MKRKDFMRNMSYIGVGLSLAPWKLATSKPSIQRFRLPPASVHIPHGNFASTIPAITRIDKMDLDISIQVFMKNGIKQTNDDLTVYSFKKEFEILNVSFIKGIYSKHGGIRGINSSIINNSIVLLDGNSVLNLQFQSKVAECKSVNSSRH